MRKIFVQFDTGYCGEDGADVFAVDDDETPIRIEAYCEAIAIENAATYGHDDEEDLQDISWKWVDYASAHDMYRYGGGTFEDDF